MSLSAIACDGGIVLDWSAYGGDGFARFVTLRKSTESIPAAWPPSGGAVAVDSASTTNPAQTDGFHLTPSDVGTLYYRVLALGSSNQVLAASPVRSAVTHAVEPLGGLTVTPGTGNATFGWSSFGSAAGCFTQYRLVWSATSGDPSYVGAHDGSVPIASQTTNGIASDAFGSGTFWFRIEAIRTTSLGSFVIASTTATQATIP